MINWKYLVIAFFTISCTSCLNIIEEVTVEEDGSGYYEVTFDMGGVFFDAELKGLIRELIYDQKAFLKNGVSAIDTVITFSEVANRGVERPDFWREVSMHLTINERSQVMMAQLSFPFQDTEEINYFYSNLDLLNPQQGSIGVMASTPFLPKGMLFEFRKKEFIRHPSQTINEDLLPEELEHAKLFYKGASYTTIYHLPGKIKKTTIPSASVDEGTLKAEYALIDIMQGRVKIEGEVKFK